MHCVNLLGEDSEEECPWNVWQWAPNQMFTFPRYSKRAKNFTLPKNIISDFSLTRVLCDLHCMMNQSLTPYLHCTRLRRITAPRSLELIRCTVASFWSSSLCCITTDRHLVYVWKIIIIIIITIVSLSSKTSAAGIILDCRRYTILLSIGTLNWVVMMLRFLVIMYSLKNYLLLNVC